MKKISNENKNTTKFTLKDIQAFFLQEASEDISREVLSTIKSIPFNRFSIPLNAYRCDIFGTEDDASSHKCITIGFIKSFDPDTCTFNATIFNAFKDAVNEISEKGIGIDFGVFKDHLSRINRLILINASGATEETSEATNSDDEGSPIEQTETAE